ncbi:hypothetical protein STRTUCAR8_08604 [Streptomyces turgidiscabies Car8]|uniref:Uncharacterized protein n=1 Tax=Streptomyces turgidiscabies (strain Car8) TaxID=698760 RepID=L7FAH4_STRT8|nr:hypothetical protein [Streptomyces turgidiscabies]ELP67655.1 hypothetical protein STRTUCAR8_08604 [Streptomyces turgidiscabies Car8]
MTDLGPASQRLLREIAKYDKGTGVQFQYVGRGRFSHPNTLAAYNQGTFRPLYRHGLVDDGGDDSAPVRVTEAGRALVVQMEAQAAEQQAAKKARAKPSADGPTALRLLREIAKQEKPAPIYNGGGRRVWSLGRDGRRASIDTWMALQKAGLIDIKSQFAGGQRVSATDAGRKRIA